MNNFAKNLLRSSVGRLVNRNQSTFSTNSSMALSWSHMYLAKYVGSRLAF